MNVNRRDAEAQRESGVGESAEEVAASAPDSAWSPHRHFDVLGSTNDEAREWAWSGAPHLSVVTAEQQTAGRGRRGRAWVSPPGRGLYASFVLRSSTESERRRYQLVDVPRLTMLLALAAVYAVGELTGLRATTKWPNDVLLNGRKVAGILCEAHSEPTISHVNLSDAPRPLAFCVAGIGLNVNFAADELPARPVFPASSLLIETGRTFEMERVLDVLRTHFAQLLTRYDAGEWETLRARWESRCAELGRNVTVREAEDEWSGTVLMTESDGALVVGTPDGLRRVVAGEITYNGPAGSQPHD